MFTFIWDLWIADDQKEGVPHFFHFKSGGMESGGPVSIMRATGIGNRRMWIKYGFTHLIFSPYVLILIGIDKRTCFRGTPDE